MTLQLVLNTDLDKRNSKSTLYHTQKSDSQNGNYDRNDNKQCSLN